MRKRAGRQQLAAFDVLESRIERRCADVEKLHAILAKEFRYVVDQSEARMRALVQGERAVIENLTAALNKAIRPQSSKSADDDLKLAKRLSRKKRRRRA